MPSEIVERFQRILRDTPARPLIHLPLTGTTITVSDLDAAARACRAALVSLAVGPDGLVMLAVGNRPSAFAFWLACREIGCAVMPVDAGAAASELRSLAHRFGASVVLAPDGAHDAASIGETQPCVPGITAIRVTCEGRDPQVYRGAAALKLTSGSTGLPKATFTTERQLVVDSEHIVEAMSIGPDDTQVAAIPLSHAYGLGNLLMPALLQGTAVILREGFVPHQLPADARTYGARAFPGVPFMFDHLAATASGEPWPGTLRTLISAGAKLEPSTVSAFHAAFGVKIHSFYGTSETGGITFDDTDGVSGDPTVGRPMPGVAVTLRPEADAGDRGRVHVASDAVSCGYAGEPSAGQDFVDGGFLTGDFGRFDRRGHLVLTGRASLFINVAGRKVQPEEVEQVLRQLPEIADVRVVAAADAARGQQIVACLVHRGDPPGILAIRQFCAARLAAYKIPRTIIWLDRIPLTERGKTDRARLQLLVEERVARGSVTGVL